MLNIIGSAAVSRRTFYDLYRDKADAFCTVHGETLARLGREVDRACAAEPEWPRGVAAAIAAALSWAAAEPSRAHLLVGEPFSGPRRGYCHDPLIARFSPHLRRGRAYGQTQLPPGLEELLLGGLAGLAATRLRTGRQAELPGLAADCTEFVLSPYLSGGA